MMSTFFENLGWKVSIVLLVKLTRMVLWFCVPSSVFLLKITPCFVPGKRKTFPMQVKSRFHMFNGSPIVKICHLYKPGRNVLFVVTGLQSAWSSHSITEVKLSFQNYLSIPSVELASSNDQFFPSVQDLYTLLNLLKNDGRTPIFLKQSVSLGVGPELPLQSFLFLKCQ